jgi:putative oxygen-independent coproporphyrinogen III oxidase
MTVTLATPLSLYIHFPWCVQKCPYCDFNSHALRNKDLPEDAYINQLIHEFDHHLNELEARPLHSLFLGGGTPSLFSAKAIERLLNHIKKTTNTADDTEITLEANPGTLTNQKYPDFLSAGINRLSIGVQSFNPQHLKKLGRIHDPKQAINAIEQAAAAGFKRINADLMHGLPQQTPQEALQDLSQALSLPITHLSWYQLTLEPNTLFHRFPPALPNDNALWEIQRQGQEKIKAAGFDQYEVSAYCKNSDTCQHNLNYWSFGDYLGIGAGAHSKITDNEGITRYENEKHPKKYQNPELSQVIAKTTIAKKEIAFEFFLNAFRLYQPIKKELFTNRTGLSLDSVQTAIQQAKNQGFITENIDQWVVTDKGRLFLNDLLELFLNPH